jgi:hypothetical protein
VVDPPRIADADDIVGGVAIEPEAEAEIDLLGIGQPVALNRAQRSPGPLCSGPGPGSHFMLRPICFLI